MTRKGNKPDFHRSAAPSQARELYDYFVAKVREGYAGGYGPDRVKDGVFGAMMQVGLVNDGPVSVIPVSLIRLAVVEDIICGVDGDLGREVWVIGENMQT